MGNVKALRNKDISPAIVLTALQEANERGEIDDIYVVALKGHTPLMYASGNLNNIGLAHVAMMSLINDYIHGTIEEE